MEVRRSPVDEWAPGNDAATVRSRRPLLVAAVTAALLTFVLATAAASAPIRAGATGRHLFAPFNGAGGIAAGVRIGKRGRGYCWTGSLTDARPDAWRCFLGNFILDPCFSGKSAATDTFVLCADSPWRPLTRLVLTKPLPRATGNRKTNPMRTPPWAIQLRSGARCVFVSGATSLIAGRRINYFCGRNGAVLVGLPRRGAATWTILVAPRSSARTLSPQPIAHVWW
jgi:hypothetical protein